MLYYFLGRRLILFPQESGSEGGGKSEDKDDDYKDDGKYESESEESDDEEGESSEMTEKYVNFYFPCGFIYLIFF